MKYFQKFSKHYLILAFGFLMGLYPPVAIAQKHLPIIRAASTVVDVRDGNYFRKGYWSILPDVRPDIYQVDRFKGRKTVTFYTDKDSISFDVEKGRTYDFIILLNNKDSAYTRISALTPPAFSYRNLSGSNTGTDTIHFTLGWKNQIHFKGKINGSELLKMMFDTGANGVVMSSDAYDKNVKLQIDGTIQGYGLGEGAAQIKLT